MYAACKAFRLKAMTFTVYRLRYSTKWNTTRTYIGYTGQGVWRNVWHEIKSNHWNKYRDPGSQLEWKELETNVASKPLALALEAFHAARAVHAEPEAARGGPYSRPTLTKLHLQELAMVCRMRMVAMMAYAQEYPESALALHLGDLSYKTGRQAHGMPVARGVAVVRKKQSGPSGGTGSASRKSQILRGIFKKPSAHNTRLHRGIDAKARRQTETAARKERLASTR